MMKLICIVKGMTLQNPAPKACAESTGATPMNVAATVTPTTARRANAKASGNQRSDQAQQRKARAESAEGDSIGSMAFIAIADSN
jgi:hypothetical protein